MSGLSDLLFTYRDPSGNACIGGQLGLSAAIGTAGVPLFPTVGFAFNINPLSAAICFGGPSGFNVGLTPNAGAFIGGPKLESPSDLTNLAGGIYGGAGLSGFFSPQATSITDLGGAFRQDALDIAIPTWFNFEVSQSAGQNAAGTTIDVITSAVPFGLSQGVGVAVTSYDTGTLAIPLWSENGGLLTDAGPTSSAFSDVTADPFSGGGGGDVFFSAI